MIWAVDGYEWDLPCTVERTTEIQASEISGLLLDKSYFNDVIGTFLKYDIRIEVPIGREEEYADLYDNYLSQPVSGHTFDLPYVGGMITVVGRIEDISDVYVRLRDGKIHWKGIQFSVIGNHPTKHQTLDGAISTFGVPSLPTETDISVGTIYIYGTDGWDELPDAEDFDY